MVDQQIEPRDSDADVLARKVSFLSRPDSYSPAPERVVTRETHMSWVFMAGDRVYKLKKPVRFPYLDFSTLDRRIAACQAEVSLNRKLAPDVYLGIAPLAVTATGYAIGERRQIADYLVVMRRLDENETLEALLLARRVSQPQIQRVADNLCQFYAHAFRATISPENYLLSLRKSAALDCQILLHPTFDLNRGTIGRIASIQRRFLKQHADVLKERVRRRFIMETHGDLRPEHIWLSAPFPVIDCLEFNARLRTQDALDEVAFLHLECERLGGRWVGETLLRRLATPLGDDMRNGLFLFYRIGRALLRARLSIAHLMDVQPRTPEKWPKLARTYLAIAAADARQLERLLSYQA